MAVRLAPEEGVETRRTPLLGRGVARARGAELAFGTSPRHLSRLFHEHVGMHLADYRNRLRAALARELIGQTRLDMERVAERAGFASARQFRRVWRKLYDAAPRASRGKLREPVTGTM